MVFKKHSLNRVVWLVGTLLFSVTMMIHAVPPVEEEESDDDERDPVEVIRPCGPIQGDSILYLEYILEMENDSIL